MGSSYLLGDISGFVKLNYLKNTYQTFEYNQINLSVSSYYKYFNINISSQINWIAQIWNNSNSNVSLSYRLSDGMYINTSTLYNISENKIFSFKIVLEKSISQGNLSLFYERNVLFKDNYFGLNIKFDLSFAKINLFASQSMGSKYASEIAQGSIEYDANDNYTNFNQMSSVGKGGMSIYPFLDLNHNGIFDSNEHILKLNTIIITGAKIIYSEVDSVIRVINLNSFTNYLIELSDNNLENIAWRFKHETYQVTIDPNQIKRLDIAVIPVGEVSGMVFFNLEKHLKGIGRILIKFYNKNNSKLVSETLSESDGFFDYLGLVPGEYFAEVDSLQLSKLGYSVSPLKKYFEIRILENGDIIEGLDFELNSIRMDKVPLLIPPKIKKKIKIKR